MDNDFIVARFVKDQVRVGVGYKPPHAFIARTDASIGLFKYKINQ